MSTSAPSTRCVLQNAPPRPYRFNDVLRGARYAEGIERQAEAAALVGVPKSRWWEWETGRVRPSEAELARVRAALPILDHLLRLAQPLAAQVDLLGWR